MGEADGPELAAAQAVEHPAEERARPVLGADLDHATVLASRRHHLLPFPQVVRERLLNVDVLASLARPDGREGVPVVRQGDDHGVDTLVVEHFAGVVIRGYLPPVVTGRLEFAVEVRPVHIAERDDLDAGDLAEPADKLVATPAHTSHGCGRPKPDDRDIHGVVGAARPGPGAGHPPWHPQRQTGRN